MGSFFVVAATVVLDYDAGLGSAERAYETNQINISLAKGR
jgi:hypothetical protein